MHHALTSLQWEYIKQKEYEEIKMWNFLNNLKDFLSLDNRSIFIVAAASWTIVLIPESLWSFLGVYGFWLQHRSIISIIGVLFSLWLILGVLFDSISKGSIKVNNWLEPRRMQKTRKEILLSTSRVEREVLAKFINEDTTTIAFDVRDGEVNGLIKKGLLYQASQASNPMSMDFDINIQPWVWEFLHDHSELLDGIQPKGIGRHQIRFKS